MKTELLKHSYKLVKPVLFQMDAEFVHNKFTDIGRFLGNSEPRKNIVKNLFLYKNNKLKQNINNINFDNPIGLAAGFDYNANLTQILPCISFGFATIGTVTNMAYEGNPSPRLGRLPKSKSLLVNKGFKSEGANSVIARIENKKFEAPIGVSIGRTNSAKLETLTQSIDDIANAFKLFEKSGVNHSYYEMNISCPNIIHNKNNISFYPAKNLNQLLTALDKLKIKKPIYIKMPITETDNDVINMLNVIVKHNIAGVIFGNLEKDRKNKVLNKNEIADCGMGNFSGKPCRRRSNELISLAYQKHGSKLTIVGCGGVFNAEDAYEKIKRGASLIEMITGIIFEGPQVLSEINEGLATRLEADGYKNVSEAIGVYYR